MYKKFALALLLCMTFLTACGTNEEADQGEQIRNELDPNRNDETPTSNEEENRLGFVHYTRDQVNTNDEKGHAVTMDRHKIADMITRIILRTEGINEVATLVTDREVLIAYVNNDDLEEDVASDIAKQTAIAAMPSYFEVYVSNDRDLIADIRSLHNSTPQGGEYRNTITSIVQEMKRSPQGIDKENDQKR
ncbi:YhcN/YlaJ family sporulation lipoprotein [Virgibacillus sp. DJP39]|uniref:YhcN/YlaJ family sporulation lipoprotein n=1 Tax=Virgibacillus sp. DJP39 TaxID=3409790 RepID=UPI003BB55181